MQAEAQAVLVYFVQLFEEAVGQCRFHYNMVFQEERCHHRHIGQRQD